MSNIQKSIKYLLNGLYFVGEVRFNIYFPLRYTAVNRETNERGADNVARARHPYRDKTKQRWIDSNGTITTKDLAEWAGVTQTRIRKWKSEDKWRETLDKLKAPKRGGQKGNKNATGHGAPKGNTNAETHGAFTQINLENLSKEDRQYIENLSLDIEKSLKKTLQLLYAKERDLAHRILFYKNAKPDELFIDKVIEMFVPSSSTKNENKNLKLNLENNLVNFGDSKTTMQTVIKSSSFERMMKIEAEYNKLLGRILKVNDIILALDTNKKRLDLDERKHTLSKQRALGEYTVDPDTGELVDAEDSDST